MKNQKSIEERVIERLLSKLYPQNLLNALSALEEYTLSTDYSEKEGLIKQIYFLKGTRLTFSEIRSLRKSIRRKLVNEINAIAKQDNDKNAYEISVLIYALHKLSHQSEGVKGIYKRNPNIQYYSEFVERMINLLGDECNRKICIKNLKLLD